jgi:ferric-dicitrate binding protein FerR (iron transport regulator)
MVEIIIHDRLGDLSPGECLALDQWLAEKEENREMYRRVASGESMTGRLRSQAEVEGMVDYDELQVEVSRRIHARRSARRRMITRGVAAAACIAGVALGLFFARQPAGEAIPAGTLAVNEEAREDRVTLVLNTGERIGLSHGIPDAVRQQLALSRNEEGILTYGTRAGDTVTREEKLNKIITASGTDYSVILSDGTRVWLNSKTELEFPESFSSGERVVTLKGEAYFQVQPDAGRPFIVRSENVQTRVVGTAFNVNAYPDEKDIRVTLESGKVEVYLDVNEVKSHVSLLPGMQSTWVRGTGRLAGRHVKVTDAVAWREGVFVFNEDEVGRVLRVLARWYDVRFVYDADEIGVHTFSGRMSNDEPLSFILENLTMAGGPRFEITGGNEVKVTRP